MNRFYGKKYMKRIRMISDVEADVKLLEEGDLKTKCTKDVKNVWE